MVVRASSPKALFVSEVFESIQGEGHTVGAVGTFLRLAGCNLRCEWCDTKYTWDWNRFDKSKEVSRRPIKALAEELSSAARIFITGGEPLLQAAGIGALLAELPERIFIEVETNGTLVPDAALSSRVNQWNVSPKLASAGDVRADRIRLSALTQFRNLGGWLKLVVDGDEDLAEAEALVTESTWPAERVLLQPQARTEEELLVKTRETVKYCVKTGYRLSPRLHLAIWGTERSR